MDLDNFNTEQKYYIDLLSKFAPRTNRIKLITASSMGHKKEIFIRENLNLLDVDQTVAFNECREEKSQVFTNLNLLFPATSALCMTYFIITTSTTKSLVPGGLKSLGAAGLISMAYYQYKNMKNKEKLHSFYAIVLAEKRRLRGEYKN